MSTPPDITSALPLSGDLNGGTQVNIAGSGFSNATDVLFGLEPATEFDVENDTLILAIVPQGEEAGTVPITVVTPNGDSVASAASQFTYISIIPPVVTSVFPALGSVAGGTQISISGSGFSGATAVNFGSISATQFIANSDGSILVTSPAGSGTGIVPVTVTTPSGSSASSPAAVFTYTAATTSGSTGGKAAGDASGTDGGGTAKDGSTTTPTNGGATKTQGKGNPTSPGANPAKDDGSDDTSTTKPTTPTKTATTPSDPSIAPTPKNPATPTTPSTPATPPPGDYIPGGLGPVPDGKTGLGGTAGTGLGFGVGQLIPGGGGSAPESNLPYYVDPAITAQLVQSLLGIVQNAASPDALEAQNIILRRMALQGDVIGSRIPPPRNISEIGGYLNLLSTLKEQSMREQTLAGILGVAGPSQPLGWISNNLPLSMVAVTNDRPAVSVQSSIPLTVLVRSDFVGPLQTALKTLHSYGATLPLTSPSVLTLPPGGTGSLAPTGPNILYYLGRALSIAPNVALSIPGADAIALVGPSAGGPFQLASNTLNTPTAAVPPASQASTLLTAVICNTTSQSTLLLTTSPYVLIAPTLALAGYYPATVPVPVPANSTVHGWAWLTNTTGLVAGSTLLGDELSLLFRQDQIASSVFAAMLTWKWSGTSFAP